MASQSITIIPGDGIGPSIVEATLKVLDKLKCGFAYEFCDCGITAIEKKKDLVPKETIDSVLKNKVALKGPVTTPIGGGFTSINVTLRKMFDLYANVRPAISFPGTKSRFEKIDIITIRENTEGMYSGQGQTIDEAHTHAEAVSVVTQHGAERIARYAFELARKLGRKKVTIVHKANILKTTSGLFLETAKQVAREYPDIAGVDMIVDNCCMQLVMNPWQFDIIVTTNLFGDIVSDLCAGLVGGLGMAPGANIGEKGAIFEAVHGSAPDIAGKNIANPSSVLLAAAMMLDHLGMTEKAYKIRQAIRLVLEAKDHCTRDLGGEATTSEFTEALLQRL